mgnify:CR=1 FL=1
MVWQFNFLDLGSYNKYISLYKVSLCFLSLGVGWRVYTELMLPIAFLSSE